jgi:hypothetical protein
VFFQRCVYGGGWRAGPQPKCEDWLAGPEPNGEGWCPRPELNWDQRFRNEFIILFLFIKSFYAVKIARNCSLFTMLFPPDFISYVCRKNCQFIIGGSGFFIREKNLTELVRRFSVVLLGFPEIPRIQEGRRHPNDGKTRS